ncbi:MAG: hypothetical protein Q9170_000002 [Blastenia crenularia]
MLPEFLAGSYKRYKQDTALFTTWLTKAATSVGYKPKALKRQQPDQPDSAQSSSSVGAENVKPALPTSGRLKAIIYSQVHRFSLLNMEENPEVDPAEDSELYVAVSEAAKITSSKGRSEVAVYELEDKDDFDEELAFIIFCFFEDLHRIQDFITELWQKYKAGQCDLHTAAIPTNAAFDLVRQAEEDLIAQTPKVFSRKRSYESIAIIVFYADAFQRGVCPEARLKSNESLRVTPFDDFIFLSTAKILMKFTFMADLPKDCQLDYPLPCPPLRFNYISRPDLLGTPEMDRKEQEDLILSRYIIDRQLWSLCKGQGSESFSPPPPEDEFSQSLDRLTKGGVLSVALVFEARIFLDIQAIMGDEIQKGHRDLVRTTSEIDSIMNLKPIHGAWDVGGTGERWHKRDVDVVMRIKQTSIYWILNTPTNVFPQFKESMVAGIRSEPERPYEPLRSGTVSQPAHSPQHADMPEEPRAKVQRASSKAMPPMNSKFSSMSVGVHRVPDGVNPSNPEFQHEMRKLMLKEGALSDDKPMDPKYEETARRLNIKPIQPSEDPNYLFTTNPIWCGLMSFSMLTDYEAAGISLCNWHKSIWPTAHLYNALQQTAMISQSWPEMDELVDLHMGTLFAGQIPLSANEFSIRFALALGQSISNFSRNTRSRTDNDRIQMRQGANGVKLKVTEVSSVYSRYFENKTSLETCLVKLDKLIRNPGPRASRKELEASKGPLTNLQFLALLETNLPQVTQRLHFNYITLTKQCAKLLKDIRQQIALRYQISYPRIPTENSADQTLTWVVMQILEENSDVEEVQKFLDSYRPQDLISNFNALPRPSTAPSGLVPNHWNISIRHVELSPPGDLVVLVQPPSDYVHAEGPIQTVEGQAPGHLLNPKSLVTLQTIARLVMKAFVEGMDAPGSVSAFAPLAWATDDANFARRIRKVMTDMGVRTDSLSMVVAGTDELRTCDEAWKAFTQRLTGLVSPKSLQDLLPENTNGCHANAKRWGWPNYNPASKEMPLALLLSM